MSLTWSVKSEIIIGGNGDFRIEPISFKYKSFNCNVSFVSDGVIFENDSPNKEIISAEALKSVNSIEFSLHNLNDEIDTIGELRNDEARLVKAIFDITNIIARSIRNEGFCSRIREVSYGGREELHSVFFRLGLVNPETNSVYEQSMMSKYINISEGRGNDRITLGVGYVDYEIWNEKVIPAITSKLVILPERIFQVNAIEQYISKNYRIAVIESTISLEIALNSFLSSYLKKFKGLSNESLKVFLGPDVGLTARVVGILPLTVNAESLAKIDINSVLRLIKWRNKIVHAIGDIPEGTQQNLIKESFDNVIQLIDLLSNKKSIVESSDELKLGRMIELP